MRAAIYARVSSAKQREAESIGSQLLVLREYVRKQGWELVGEYRDDGKSAKTGRLAKRAEFQRLMADAEAGAFDVLAVFDVSRLTRSDSIEERALILGPFQRLGIKIVTPSGGVQDLRSFLGEFYVMLQAQVAAEENRKRAEGIMAGKLRAIAEGRKPAGPTPFGYDYDRRCGWSISETDAPTVREIHARIADGMSCERIARMLEDSGATRPRGGAWTRERVYDIARARTYLGEWTADKGRGLVIKVPTILTEAEWLRTHRALANARKRGLDRSQHVYLLGGGLARCQLCDARIGVASGSGPNADRLRRTYYVCRKRFRPWRGDPHRCTLRFHEVGEADERLWSAVDGAFQRTDVVERALALRAEEARATEVDWRRDLRDAEARLGRLARAEAAMLARFRRGRISEAAMDVELDALGRERALLEHQVAAARRAGAGAELAGTAVVELQATVDGIRRLVRRANPKERLDLVTALLGERGVILGPDAIMATMRLRADARVDVSRYRVGLETASETGARLVVELPLVA